MGLFVPTILLLVKVKLGFIGFVLALQGCAGFSISPSPAIDLDIPPIRVLRPVYQERPVDSIAPTSSSRANGSSSNTPDSLRPLISAPAPQTRAGLVPSHLPSVPVVTPPSNATASPPLISQEHESSSPPDIPFLSPSDNGASPPLSDQEQLPPTIPDDPGRHELIGKPPISLPDLAPAAPPVQSSLPNSSVIHPSTQENSPTSAIPPSTPLQSSPPQSSPVTPENSPPSAIPPSTPLQSSSPHSSLSTPENPPPSAIPPSTPLQSSPPHSSPGTPENPPLNAIPPSTILQSPPPYSFPSRPENPPASAIPPSTSLQSSPPHTSPSTPENPLPGAVPPPTPFQSSPPHSSPSAPKNPPPSAIPPPTPLRSSPPRSSPSTPETLPPSAIPPSTPLQSSPPHTSPSTPENPLPGAVPPPTPLQSSPPHSSLSAPKNPPPSAIPPPTPLRSSPPRSSPSTPENLPPSAIPPSTPLQSSPPHSSPSIPENPPPSAIPPSTPLQSSPPHSSPRTSENPPRSAIRPPTPSTTLPSSPAYSSVTHPRTPENSPPDKIPPPTPFPSSPPHPSVTHPSTPENSPSIVPPSTPMQSSPPHPSVIRPSSPENSPPSTVPPSPPMLSSSPRSPITHPSPPENFPSTVPPSPPMVGSPSRLPVTHPSPPEISPSSAHHRNGISAPTPTHFVHGPVASPTREDPKNKRQDHHIKHEETPSTGPAPVPYPRFPPNKGYQTPPLPSPTFNKRNHERTEINVHAPVPAYPISPPPSKKGLVIPPSILPARRHSYPVPQLLSPGSPVSTSHRPYSKPVSDNLTAPSPSTGSMSGWNQVPVLSPKASPFQLSRRSPPRMPPLLPIQALPPPPPNEDCQSTVCPEPFTNTPPGSPCVCVLPMQVGLSVNVALYTFFPLVSEFAQEIAAGVFMKLSQVRIMGAYAASQEPEKAIVLIDLVPLAEKFNNTTAFVTYHRFWHKEVLINPTFFGDYEVLYVRYPGLPQPPPLPPSAISIIGPYPGNGNNGRTIKPLGVDVSRKHHKDGLSVGVIAVITLSVVGAVVICSTVAWLLISRHRNHVSESVTSLQPQLSITKPSGTTGSMIGSGMSSASLSLESSVAPYTGSSRTFNLAEIERATNNFDASRILGEGGFGRVYSGVLDDGTEVAVKVLKRDDHQGGREFLAEVEMLSRLHHRNLVRLIGICVDEQARCLVYELVPNGNVESYLHGVQKDSTPLQWDARIKIALGAARGLAYLHEDSSPRVIHRDFKSSNILLEHDFTPKVSDFGLARTALDEENRHISTRVMGTFGYVAPEYAMTGHLLVKSDVYSYGVVLLELLTGRKPVDMTRPPGQENLVAWACPLLTSREGLQMIIDPTLGHDIPFDSVAKVAAIASMCVQSEVSNRPFMGEVVQALKLVCNECDEAKQIGSRTSSQELSSDMDDQVSVSSGNHSYDSEPDIERALPISDFYSTSVLHGGAATPSFRRCSTSGPSSTGKTKRLWLKMKELTGGSMSEHGIMYRQWSGLR